MEPNITIKITNVIDLDAKKPRLISTDELSRKKTEVNEVMLKCIQQLDEIPIECSICYKDNIAKKNCDIDILLCGHVFCSSCIDSYINSRKKASEVRCPNCRVPMREWKRFFKTHIQTIDNYTLGYTQMTKKRTWRFDRKTVFGKFGSKEADLLKELEEMENAMPEMTKEELQAVCILSDIETHCNKIVTLRDKIDNLSSMKSNIKSYGDRMRQYIMREHQSTLQIQGYIETQIHDAETKISRLVDINTMKEKDSNEREETIKKREIANSDRSLRKRQKREDDDSDDDQSEDSSLTSDSDSDSSSEEYLDSEEDENKMSGDSYHGDISRIAKDVKDSSFGYVLKRIKDIIST